MHGPLLPASQQGDFNKADFFVELLGEVMEAYAATNDKLPCVGYALDAGSSNYLARKLSLGLKSLDKFEHMAFWKDCIHKPVGLGVYFPFAVLHHKPSQSASHEASGSTSLLRNPLRAVWQQQLPSDPRPAAESLHHGRCHV